MSRHTQPSTANRVGDDRSVCASLRSSGGGGLEELLSALGGSQSSSEHCIHTSVSTAMILYQMDVSMNRSSCAPSKVSSFHLADQTRAGELRSLKTYGKMPTDSAFWTAHAPIDMNRSSSSSARSLWPRWVTRKGCATHTGAAG
jgi:hypothetical protein